MGGWGMYIVKKMFKREYNKCKKHSGPRISTVVKKHNSSPVTFVVEKPVEGSRSNESFYVDLVCDIKHPQFSHLEEGEGPQEGPPVWASAGPQAQALISQ